MRRPNIRRKHMGTIRIVTPHTSTPPSHIFESIITTLTGTRYRANSNYLKAIRLRGSRLSTVTNDLPTASLIRMATPHRNNLRNRASPHHRIPIRLPRRSTANLRHNNLEHGQNRPYYSRVNVSRRKTANLIKRGLTHRHNLTHTIQTNGSSSLRNKKRISVSNSQNIEPGTGSPHLHSVASVPA